MSADEARERAEKLDRARAFWQRACVHDGGRAVNCVECLAEFAQGERAAEREACAMIAQEDSAIYAGRDIAEAIRARGSRSPEPAPRICKHCKATAESLGPVGMWQHCPEHEGGSLCHEWPDAQASPSAQEPATQGTCPRCKAPWRFHAPGDVCHASE